MQRARTIEQTLALGRRAIELRDCDENPVILYPRSRGGQIDTVDDSPLLYWPQLQALMRELADWFAAEGIEDLISAALARVRGARQLVKRMARSTKYMDDHRRLAVLLDALVDIERLIRAIASVFGLGRGSQAAR